MSSFQSAYDHHAFAFWAVLAVLALLLAFTSYLTRRRLRRLEARLDELFSDANSENMAAMLADYLKTVRMTANAVARVKAEHDQIAAVMPSVVRHVGLVRFSPFHDTGGDQSFALALLDGQEDGVVLTGLHSRSESRLYAKPIAQGRSSYTLSPEEQQAMDRALHRRPVEAGS